MKAERIKGFTLVELLVVLAIVAMLIGLLMPALGQIRKYAGTVKQKAQIGSIEIALSLYKNEPAFGQYPPSHGCESCLATDDANLYNGAQTLAEAMVGWDLLGVHPDTAYRADGLDISGNPTIYPSTSGEPNITNLGKRKGPYLDRANIGVFKADQVFNTYVVTNRFMICDTFTKNRSIAGKQYKIGTPILYYRANPSAINTQLIDPASSFPINYRTNIYNYMDNFYLLISSYNNNNKNNNFYDSAGAKVANFFTFISDPMIPLATGALGRPQKPDSFILISAGPDGIYGTKDDICNFEPNIK